MLPPNRWVVAEQMMERAIDVGGSAVGVRVRQPSRKAGGVIRVKCDRGVTEVERKLVRDGVRRMLRLNETAESIADFHRVDPRWRKTGEGRLYRSPTLFEDVIKTVTNCNVTWPGTIRMNRRLCDVFGAKSASGIRAFPTAAKLARTRPGTLRARCSLGYRDQRTVDLAKMFVRGEIEVDLIEDRGTPDDEVFAYLKTLPGIGPFAAGNIMMLLGRYSRMAIDTESYRHGRTVLGMEGTPRELHKQVAAHFEKFGEHKFRSYWFELWKWYETKRGPAELWDRDAVGDSLTASQFD